MKGFSVSLSPSSVFFSAIDEEKEEEVTRIEHEQFLLNDREFLGGDGKKLFENEEEVENWTHLKEIYENWENMNKTYWISRLISPNTQPHHCIDPESI